MATLGQPLFSQPRVIVRDYRGTPLADRTVVVWSSNVPNIFVSSQPHVGFSAQDTADVGKLTHYVRGQDIALLSGNRAVTDADGVATWEALTIEAASSRFVYLNFYCDGVIASWNNPDLRPPISGQLLPPPAFVPPIYALSLVDEMYQLPSRTPPPDASGSGEEGAVAVARHAAHVQPRHHHDRPRGRPLDETIRVRVGRLHPAPLSRSRRTLLALMHTASGYVLPNLFRPDNSLLRSANRRAFSPRSSASQTPSPLRPMPTAWPLSRGSVSAWRAARTPRARRRGTRRPPTIGSPSARPAPAASAQSVGAPSHAPSR